MNLFDSIYKSQPFPYNMDIILKNDPLYEIKQKGAGYTEAESILYYLNNRKYNKIEGKTIDGIIYKFKINKKLNPKPPKFNSIYLAYGYVSTAIGIFHREFGDLVLKLKFVKNKRDELIYNWNINFYMRYRRERRKFGKNTPCCLFYGNKIKKEIYNPEIINELCDKPLEYDSLFSEKHIAFSIYKYYSQKIEDINKKKYILLKLSILLYHFCINNYYIYDLKYDNIGIDDNDNIIFIDYDESTYTKYKVGNKNNYKYEIWNAPQFSFHVSCNIKKRLHSLIKLSSEETKLKIEEMIRNDTKKYTSDEITNQRNKYSNAILNLIIEKVQGEYIFNYNGHKYYLSNYNLYFEKFNVISIADIIFCLCFKDVDISKLSWYSEIDISYGKFKLNNITYKRFIGGPTMSAFISSFQNINDIDLLTRFIYEFIQPIDSVEPEYINALRFLILDPITETGLLGTDFECVPPYELIAKKFKEINKDDTPIYDQFKQMIDDNIGTPKVLKKTVCDYEQELNDNYKITNVGDDVKAVLTELGLLHESFDTISYEEWQLSILVEKLMDRPENRSDTSLDLPCVNSTLPQNYIFTIDKISCETTKTIKWAKNDEEVYVETPEYRIIKRQLLSGECTQEKTKHHEELDKMNERIFARCIVSFLKGTPIISEGLTGYLLGKVDLLRTFDRRKYIRLATVQKPVKKVWESKSVRQKKESMKQEMKSKSGSTKETPIKPDLSLEWKRGQPIGEGPIKEKADLSLEWKRGQPIGKGPIGEKADLSKWERRLSIKTAEYKYLKYKNKYLELKNKIDI